MSDQNLQVTAPAPEPYPRLVAVVRGGFADEASRKVDALLEQCDDPDCEPVAPATACPYCTAVLDVLNILRAYREAS